MRHVSVDYDIPPTPGNTYSTEHFQKRLGADVKAELFRIFLRLDYETHH